MIPLKRALTSSVGRKFVMSLSGFALVMFVIVHLAGNLSLLLPDGGESFNKYAHNFESLGTILYVVELGLFSVIVFHIAWGIIITMRNRRGRSVGYEEGIKTKGGSSNLSASSRNMIISGVLIGIFIVVHVFHFRVAKIFTEETMVINGEEVTDLYALVYGAFGNPLWVLFYVSGAVFLGFHLRHGFWSAFQSLGAMKPEWAKGIYALGGLIAVLLVVGFVALPLYLFAIQIGA